MENQSSRMQINSQTQFQGLVNDLPGVLGIVLNAGDGKMNKILSCYRESTRRNRDSNNYNLM